MELHHNQQISKKLNFAYVVSTYEIEVYQYYFTFLMNTIYPSNNSISLLDLKLINVTNITFKLMCRIRLLVDYEDYFICT